ncbi:MAG: hypothetical protein KIS66_05665 [Fimbriimonadaceae bacterium]|nr:hypothetical protein [Fimbriimonadaceae bacterium]
MSLAVTRARVKEKCGVTGTDHDAAIDNLIAETVPAIEYAIRPESLAATGDVGLQATLNLGATEIVGGEFLAQRVRREGALDVTLVGDLAVRPFGARNPADPYGLAAQGRARLAPYLKADTKEVAVGGVFAAPLEDEAVALG